MLKIGKFKLEYDSSMVVCNQIVKVEVDTMSEEENNELNKEIVRRWNHFEEEEAV